MDAAEEVDKSKSKSHDDSRQLSIWPPENEIFNDIVKEYCDQQDDEQETASNRE